MMFFGDGQYPRCAAYLRTSIIGVSSKSQIYSALLACIEDEKIVKQALSPGTYPRIVIEKLSKGLKIIGGIYQGECFPEKKNYVYLDTRIPDGYEDNKEVPPYYFEKTLLHEVVHWGRFIAGKPSEIDGKEAGSWFEHLAYGIAYQYHSGIQCPNTDNDNK
jgi:hypothetical protein